MSLGLVAVLLTLAALFGLLNARTLRLPNTIGVLVMALLSSFALLAIDPFVTRYDLQAHARAFLRTIDLPGTLLNGALSLLLFAGALQTDLRELWARRFLVLALAILGTLIAVFLFGLSMWAVFAALGQSMPLIWCIVLGAILAPTDPVSVIGMLRRLGLPAPLQAVFAGESLFNDGVGVVIFGVALSIATQGGSFSGADIALRFVVEPIGGALLGLAAGWMTLLLMRATDDANLELIVSLALATGTFSLANALAMSGPVAVVMAGLTLGSRGRDAKAISDANFAQLTSFWSLLDEILNAMLFLLIGFEVIAVALDLSHPASVLIAIPLSLAVRTLSVFLASLPVFLRSPKRFAALIVLSWGGLRGGISLALALALPANDVRPSLLAVCYGVVVFTIVVQGLTIEPLARYFYPNTLK